MKICRHISCVFRIETGLVIGSEPVCPGPPPFLLHMYRTNVGKEEKSRVERNEVGHRDVSNTNNKPPTFDDGLNELGEKPLEELGEQVGGQGPEQTLQPDHIRHYHSLSRQIYSF